jgi:hypothetical protein
VLHLRPGVRELFMLWLEAEHPHLVGRYQMLYRSSEAAQEYRDGVTTVISEQREVAWQRHGRPRPQPGTDTRRRRRSAGAAHQSRDDGGEQLTLTL